MVFVWAPGDVPFELPSDMGFPLGPANFGYRSFRLQIHFDNPELFEGVIDNSGVRIFYVNSSRPIQAGMLELGDPNVQLYGEPVGRGISEHTLECGGGCSALVLPTSGVTVIRSHLHMHKTGIQASTEHIRNGTVVNKATVEFFDFAQQGIQSVQAGPYKVLPGDSFRVQCRYRTPTNGTEIIFGTASSDEMCISYLLYYPRQMIEELGYPWLCGYRSEDPCSADYSSRELDDNDELGRIFGSPMPRMNVELQADTPESFNNSLMCPLVVSPPLDNDSSTSNNDDGSASRATFSAVPFAAFLGSAIVSMQLLL
jgi:Copper type II ascorbate-dependent monooxygenase, C-terminal domain/Copper type II ascorbate-dependent monooxygenase, N-terminal domain